MDRLDELIHGSETAKKALREKDERILIDGQKKRKSTKKDEEHLKKEISRLDMCGISGIEIPEAWMSMIKKHDNRGTVQQKNRTTTIYITIDHIVRQTRIFHYYCTSPR